MNWSRLLVVVIVFGTGFLLGAYCHPYELVTVASRRPQPFLYNKWTGNAWRYGYIWQKETRTTVHFWKLVQPWTPELAPPPKPEPRPVTKEELWQDFLERTEDIRAEYRKELEEKNASEEERSRREGKKGEEQEVEEEP